MTERLRVFHSFLGHLALISITSCTSLQQTQQGGAYHEDLSKHRKIFKATIQESNDTALPQPPQEVILMHSSQPVTEQLDDWLEEKKRSAQQVKQTSGFTIQVYKGKSRDNALKAKNQVHQYFPHLQPKVSYSATNYTVRVGNFLDRQETYEAYLLIKQKMRRAIIRPILLPNTAYMLRKEP